MGGGRPGEVSTRWVARRLGMNPKSILRWCREGRFAVGAVRAELGAIRPDGEGRYVKRYWVLRDEVERIIATDQ